MKWLLIFSVSFISLINAMEMDMHQRDANGYRYENESRIADRRKIAIMAYGSLVHQPVNQATGARLLLKAAFKPTEIQLPVSLLRESSSGRLTAVLDPKGEPKRVWLAESPFTFLPNARCNLAAREGCMKKFSDNGQISGYDLTAISYMKRLLPGKQKDENEAPLTGAPGWVGRIEQDAAQMPQEAAKALALLAEQQGYLAVVWAAFPPNVNSRQQAVNRLCEDADLLLNTQAYIRNLPDGAQSSFERAVLAGRDALRMLLQNEDRERQYKNFTYYQSGDLPVILTAPHGGRKSIGVPRRQGGVQVWDDGTLELAMQVSDELFRLLGVRPYLVAADFTREHIDANRPAHQAYEHVNAKPVYDFYHGKIKEFITKMKERFGNRLFLIDVHGQGMDAKTVYRGTQNRLTVKRLIERAGEEALTGPSSILGMLSRCGNQVFPLNTQKNKREDGYFNGGWTVRHYGGHNEQGIDALQLELGWDLRRADCSRDSFARQLAQAIAQFYASYLVG